MPDKPQFLSDEVREKKFKELEIDLEKLENTKQILVKQLEENQQQSKINKNQKPNEVKEAEHYKKNL